ncbi:SPFH domain-containing protein [Paenibacillus sp. JTLBN-2024]
MNETNGVKGVQRMAIIDVVKFEGPPDVYAWRHPNQELSTWSQLIVHETQEAILFKEGQALDSFSAGRYTLSTANIPILSNFVNLPFGGSPLLRPRSGSLTSSVRWTSNGAPALLSSCRTQSSILSYL